MGISSSCMEVSSPRVSRNPHLLGGEGRHGDVMLDKKGLCLCLHLANGSDRSDKMTLLAE
jgi:hypothetical protein